MGLHTFSDTTSIIHLSSKKASFQVTTLLFRADMAGLTKKARQRFWLSGFIISIYNI